METSYGTGLELVRTDLHHLILLGKKAVFQRLADYFCLISGNNNLCDSVSSS